MKQNKSLRIRVYAFVARWIIILGWPLWPKSQMALVLDAFEVLDKYYGRPVDIEERVQLMMDKVSPDDKTAIYNYTLGLVLAERALKLADAVKPA